MKTFKEWKEKDEHLEISITCDKQDGFPISAVVRHRYKDGGKWVWDADMDSGEVDGIKNIPDKIKKLFDEFLK